MVPISQTQQANALLSQIQQNDKGKLTVFLGAAPGVGKTYAMLSAAREIAQQGVDLLVGLVETHGRADTEAMLAGFEVLARKPIDYHNNRLTEFDLDAALLRRPKLILVDELAHTNVPGSRHKRRYQDVAELLAAGIDVYTTVNIQHLVSLNDLVLQITQVRVRETVPDRFLDEAHEIIFVDLPPSTLIERLQQGKVYLPEYARSALDAFFSVSNLTALRELAMKKVIERVDAKLICELDAKAQGTDFVLKDRLLVLVSNSSDHQYLIRIGRQIAERRQIPWLVLWVDTGKALGLYQRKRLNEAFALAKELGAQTEVLRGTSSYQAILPYIALHRINTVLVGAGVKRTYPWWRKRLYQRLIESGLPVEVSVYHAPDSQVQVRDPIKPKVSFGDLRGHILGLIGVVVIFPLVAFLDTWLSNGNLVLLYVFLIVSIGLTYGARPAMATAVWSFFSFNFFLTEPKFTMNVNSQDDIATLIFLVFIGLISGPAASRIRNQFILLRESNRYAETLKDVAQELSVADDEKALWQTIGCKITGSVNADCYIVLQRKDGQRSYLPLLNTPFNDLDLAAIDWTLRHGQAAGRLSDTLSASGVSVFPIELEGTTIGAAILDWQPTVNELSPFDRELILAMLQQGANTWRRIQLVSDLESARVKTEIEQLRSALLSSVSHDLKSPLSAMMGAAESLKLLNKQLLEADRNELLDTILQESRRLDSYIQNLLDMTRLGHGTLSIERDWVSADDIIGSVLGRLKRYFPNAIVEYHREKEPPLLFVHAALIEQGLFNILENAVRFSPPEEPICIELTISNHRCCIAIEDRGPGIPVSHRDQIFDMFYVVADGDQKKQNTGMGLAICKGMIAAHGGSVRVTDCLQGQGTRFEVELPLDYPVPG
ncbi:MULTISPECIES: sensor histidine kinase [Shewanella]|uniref:histidine kinase n=2 Tax=Shewanella TaxID=22 RepID=A4YA08_SHEPC|nr:MULTISPECIES: sensor histidine kinase KdpD [Shewanella]ABM23717.1 osmosensitive K+ channel signal transduction histidine kinase [Shewanella sp. W3-18-1]QGS48836.1 DUF4118 domain-containing protein [Shewanella putrefaciens]